MLYRYCFDLYQREVCFQNLFSNTQIEVPCIKKSQRLCMKNAKINQETLQEMQSIQEALLCHNCLMVFFLILEALRKKTTHKILTNMAIFSSCKNSNFTSCKTVNECNVKTNINFEVSVRFSITWY